MYERSLEKINKTYAESAHIIYSFGKYSLLSFSAISTNLLIDFLLGKGRKALLCCFERILSCFNAINIWSVSSIVYDQLVLLVHRSRGTFNLGVFMMFLAARI